MNQYLLLSFWLAWWYVDPFLAIALSEGDIWRLPGEMWVGGGGPLGGGFATRCLSASLGSVFCLHRPHNTSSIFLNGLKVFEGRMSEVITDDICWLWIMNYELLIFVDYWMSEVITLDICWSNFSYDPTVTAYFFVAQGSANSPVRTPTASRFLGSWPCAWPSLRNTPTASSVRPFTGDGVLHSILDGDMGTCCKHTKQGFVTVELADNQLNHTEPVLWSVYRCHWSCIVLISMLLIVFVGSNHLSHPFLVAKPQHFPSKIHIIDLQHVWRPCPWAKWRSWIWSQMLGALWENAMKNVPTSRAGS